MIEKNMHGGSIVGVTDEGFIIVTEGYNCPHWAGKANATICTRECWYCRYADFRKDIRRNLSVSICRHPSNMADLVRDAEKNEIDFKGKIFQKEETK